MNNVLIRDFKESDFELVSRIWTETGVGNPARGDNIELILNTIKFGGKFLVLLYQNQLIGTSWITNDQRRLYLHHFAIVKKFQKRGFGKLLLEASMTYAKETGLQIKLEVHKENRPALNLYKNYGFKYLGDYDVYIIRKY